MKRLHQAFKSIGSIELPAHLETEIIDLIKMEKLKGIRRRLIFSEVGLVGSMLAIFYVIFTSGSALIRSEFWSMMTLLFSDAGTVLSNWQDFVFSAMETFPVFTVISMLLPIFILFISIAYYFSNHKKISGLSGNSRPLVV